MFKKALSLLLALMLVVASVSITAISVSAADGDDEPDTSTWYVVGNNADLLGKAWAADEANIMTLGEDGKYTKVYTDVAPTTGGDPISIKVMNTVDWIGNKYGKNIVVEIDETCDVTVTYDPNLVDATQVTVTGEHVKMHDFSPATVEQMAAVGYRELGMALKGNHLITYPVGLVAAEVAGGAQGCPLGQDRHLVVVTVELTHLPVGEIGLHLFVHYMRCTQPCSEAAIILLDFAAHGPCNHLMAEAHAHQFSTAVISLPNPLDER
jgi:hypothetical protein